MADEQIITNITAKADFSQLIGDLNRVTNSLAALQERVAATNKSLANQVKVINKSFADTMRSTGQFSTHYVSLTSDVDKFGKSLDSGRLKLKDYYRVWQENAKTSGGLIRQLAQQQVQLQNAVLQPLGRNAQGLMQFNVHIPRGLDLIKNKTAITTQELKIMNKVVQDGAVQLINWGKNTQWAGRQLTVGLTLPLAAFGKAAADSFREADAQLTRLTKVYGDIAGASASDLSKIRNEVAATSKELAATMGVNFQETIGLAADIAATGKTGNDLLSSVKETTRLAVLGEVDRQEAMKATLAIQTAFKSNTEELSQSINFLNAVENQTSTSLNDLVEAIPKAGPVIKGLGGSVQDLALYLTAMREGGVSASEGANALKSALASLINPTDVAVSKFEGFGIDLMGIVNRNAGDVTKTLFSLQAALDTLNPLQKQQAIEQLFGKFQFSRLNALFNNLGKEGSQTLQVLDLMKASAADLESVASRELAMVTESASGKYKRAVESLKADLAGVGEEFLKIGTSIVTVLDGIIKFGQKLPDPIKKLLAFGTAFTAIVGPVIMLTGLLANFFGYIVKGIFHFKSLFKNAEGWKLLTPEILAAQKAGSLVEQTFYSDAKAAAVLKQALADLSAQYDILAQKATAATLSTNPNITTLSGGTVVPGTGRVVDVRSPLVSGMASSHLNPRDPKNPATIFGLVPGSDIVNQKIGRTPQIMMEERLPNIEGLTSVRANVKGKQMDISTGVVASEAARYQALIATLGMQSKQEITELKKTIEMGGAVSTEFIQTFDDILPMTTSLSQNAARQSTAIVAELRAGKITVDQAKAQIMAVNAQLERDLGIAVSSYAAQTGREIDLTKVPMIDQPVVDASGKSNMRALFRRGRARDILRALGRATRTRTFGAPYSIETTIPPKFNSGGMIYNPKNQGGIVPGNTAINYDIVPAEVPVGGFVLNQAATRNNPDLAAMASAGYSGGGQTTPAMLTPGEAVFTPEFTAANYDILSAANSGQRIRFSNTGGFVGGMINKNKFNYGNVSVTQSQAKDLLAKYVAFISDKSYEDNIKARAVIMDASELMALGFDPEDAINIADSFYDEAISESRNQDGSVDTNKFTQKRSSQLDSIQKDLDKFFPGKSSTYKGSSKSQSTSNFRKNSGLIKQLMKNSGRYNSKILSSIDVENFHRAHFIRRSLLPQQGVGYLFQAGILPPELNFLQHIFESKSMGEDRFDPTSAGAKKHFEQIIKNVAGENASVDDVARAISSPTKFPKAAEVKSGQVTVANKLQKQILRALISRMVMPKAAAIGLNSGGMIPGGMISRKKFNYGLTPIQGMPGYGPQNAATGGHSLGPVSSGMGFGKSMLLGTAGSIGGSMLGQAVGGVPGSIAGSMIGGMLPSLMQFRNGMFSLTSVLTKTNVALAGTAAGVYALKKAYDSHQKTLKQQSLAFGLDAKAAEKAGLTYVDFGKKLRDTREQIETSRQQMELLYASITEAAPGSKLNLTIEQLKKLKSQVKETMPEYIELINKSESGDGLQKVATSLKAQFMSAGQSAEKATQTVYALIAASNKANEALSSITTKSFQSIKNLNDAAIASARNVRSASMDAERAIAPWTKNGRIQGLTNSLNTFFQAVNASIEDIIRNGEIMPDGTKRAVTEAEALNRQYKEMENSGLKNVEVTKEMKSALASIDPLLSAMVNRGNSLYGVYAKYRLLLQGIRADISGLTDDQAAVLSSYTDAVGAGVTKNLSEEYGVLGSSVTNLNKLNAKLLSLQKASQGESVRSQINTRKEIELINKKIEAINKEAEARRKALEEEQEASDISLQIKQKQLDYQDALAAGDMSRAAQAQIDIQRLAGQQQFKLAQDAIEQARLKKVEPLEKRKDELSAASQKKSDLAGLAGEDATGTASQRDKLSAAMTEFQNAYSTFRTDMALNNLKIGSPEYQKTIVALLSLFKKAGGESKFYTTGLSGPANTPMLNQASALIKNLEAGTQGDVNAALKDAAINLKAAGLDLTGSADALSAAAGDIKKDLSIPKEFNVKSETGGSHGAGFTQYTIPYDSKLKKGQVIKDKKTGKMYTIDNKIDNWFGSDYWRLVPKKAGGGRVVPGYGYIVGENRPEFFKPDVPGYIYPNIGTANYNVPTVKSSVNGFNNGKMGGVYNVNNKVVVNTLPGQDEKAIAREVITALSRMNKESSYKSGESIYYGGRI